MRWNDVADWLLRNGMDVVTVAGFLLTLVGLVLTYRKARDAALLVGGRATELRINEKAGELARWSAALEQACIDNNAGMARLALQGWLSSAGTVHGLLGAMAATSSAEVRQQIVLTNTHAVALRQTLATSNVTQVQTVARRSLEAMTEAVQEVHRLVAESSATTEAPKVKR